MSMTDLMPCHTLEVDTRKISPTVLRILSADTFSCTRNPIFVHDVPNCCCFHNGKRLTGLDDKESCLELVESIRFDVDHAWLTTLPVSATGTGDSSARLFCHDQRAAPACEHFSSAHP